MSSQPGPVTGLKESDWFQGIAIGSGIVAGSAFVGNVSTPAVPAGTITGIFSVIALVATSISQWLQSKGH